MDDQTKKTANNTQPNTTPEKNSGAKIKHPESVLHTYRDDVEKSVRKGKISMVRALATEINKKSKSKKTLAELPTQEPHRSKTTPGISMRFIIISSFIMIALGLLSLIALLQAGQLKRQIHINKTSGAPVDMSLIFTEYRSRIDTTDLPPKEVLFRIKKLNDNINATLGSMTNVILEKKEWDPQSKATIKYQLTQSEAIKTLGLDFPQEFMNLLGPEASYIVGIHVADRNTPFIIITTTSYEHAVEALLKWEKTAERRLSPLMDTEGSTSPTRTFTNMVVKNIPARVIRDDQNNIRLLYAFLDENTILITNNVLTLSEVSRRFNIRKASKNNL